MIYLISLFRRFTAKSSFYLMFLVSIIVLFFSSSWQISLIVLGCGTVLVQFIAYLINELDKSKKTGIKCKLCWHDDCVLLYPGKKKKTSDGDFGSFACSSYDHGKHSDIYYCPMCRNGFLKDIGSEKFEDTKNAGYDLYENVIDQEYIKNIAARHQAFGRLIDKYDDYFRGKDILEVGCYYGAFVDVSKDRVQSYTGIEPSKHACDYVIKKNQDVSNVDIVNGNVDSIVDENLLVGKMFDTICMFDVIEHVPDPIKMIRTLRQYLRPGGYLIFSTINIESSLSLALGPKWPWYMDMHYYYFSDRGYVDMLHRSGYGLKKHAHFAYAVKAHYFISKVMAMFFFRINLPKPVEKLFDFIIPITLGDVVLIIGKKEKP